MKFRVLFSGCWLAVAASSFGAIVVSGAANKTSVASGTTVTVTVNAEAGFNVVGTLDGQPLTLGQSVQVTAPRYHEVKEVRTPTGGGAATTNLYQFIIRAAGRGNTEDGLPPFTPAPVVSDAPSAFAGKNLVLVAPPQFPKNLPIPLVGMLRDGASDPVWLNGVVRAGNFPLQPLQLLRGWGSLVLPAATGAGALVYNGKVGPVEQTASIAIEDSTVWTTKTGTIATETWGPNGRIDVTGSITLTGTLTVLPNTVVRLAQGVEINVNEGAHLVINATPQQPACFVAQALDKPWGGIWLRADTAAAGIARMTANGAIFSSWGNDYNWFDDHSGFGVHRREEACVLIDTNAVCQMDDCYIIDGRGQTFHTRNATLDLARCLIHRATSGGEQNGGQVDIDRCAVIEFFDRPNGATNVFLDVNPGFVDGDNDGLYLVPGHDASNVPRTWTLTKTLIGWTKDDGIDTGGGGDGVTVAQNCWFESCVHEAMSHSGTGRVPKSLGSVHFSCGQGFECGYDGPLSFMDGSAVIDCMVGARFGDNYVSGMVYGGTLTVQNSLLLYNQFHDVWGMAWNSVHGVAAAAWTYNSQWMTINNNKLTEANSFHPNNTMWNPATDGALLTPFMPVPDSKVGVAFQAESAQNPLAAYPAALSARLSTFSSKPVTVGFEVVWKTAPDATEETVLGSGTLSFAPGEVTKSTGPLPVPPGNNFNVVIARLKAPTNAEITGPALLYYKSQPAPPNQTLVAMGAGGWSYSAIRAEPAAGWKGLGYTEQAAQWQTSKTAPIGFGQIGNTAPLVTLGTTLSAAETGTATARTKAVYFRKTFNLANAASVATMTVQLMRDDGAVIYINGYEATRNNIDSQTTPGGIIDYDTLATGNISGDAEKTLTTIPVPQSIFPHLEEGTNVITVEVHQDAVDSSDLVMDLSLSATFGSPPAISSFGVGEIQGQPFLYWLDPTVQYQWSTDLTNWIHDPAATSPAFLEIAPEPGRMFFRLEKP